MRRLFFVPLVLSLTLLAAACGSSSNNNSNGGGGTASGDDAAVVDGDHITQATLDRRLSEAACSYKLQKKAFPKPGTSRSAPRFSRASSSAPSWRRRRRGWA